MKNQKLPSTNKLIITYNNGKKYTIPRVKSIKLGDNGKSVSGTYTKVINFDGVEEKHLIDFTIDLKDVHEFHYRAKRGQTSYWCSVNKGRISSRTEIRDNSWYEPKIKTGIFEAKRKAGIDEESYWKGGHFWFSEK